jgi:hypothetical protein
LNSRRGESPEAVSVHHVSYLDLPKINVESQKVSYQSHKPFQDEPEHYGRKIRGLGLENHPNEDHW